MEEVFDDADDTPSLTTTPRSRVAATGATDMSSSDKMPPSETLTNAPMFANVKPKCVFTWATCCCDISLIGTKT